MLARTLRLKIISSVSSKRQQFIVLGPIQLVDIQFKRSSCRKVILLITKARKDHTRKHKRSRQSHLIAVHCRRTVFARLPFIRTIQLNIPRFAAAKHIVLRYSERSSRTCLVITFHLHIEIQLGIIRFVESRMNIHIQRITHKCRVARSILHFKIAEDTHVIQTLLHTSLTIQTIQVLHGTPAGNTGTVLYLTLLTVRLVVQPPVNHVGTHPQLVVIINTQPLIIHTVIRSLSLLSIKIEGPFTYIKRLFGNRRHTGSRHHAHSDMSAGHQSRICLIGQIVGTEIIASHIAQQGTDAGTFSVKIGHIKLFARTDERTAAAHIHDLQSPFTETMIVNRINEIGITHIHRILYLRL